jgi:2-hydroxychromene-2-carboxylate isomerase
MRRILFHFDFISPFAYLAWTQIHALAARHAVELLPIPTLFAALLAEGKTRGPAEIPAKRRYFFRDAFRTAHLLGVPLEMPPSHPFNPLLALRIASLPLEPAQRDRAITALFDASWAGGGGIETPERVVASLDAAGLPGQELVARAPQAKDELRRATDDAIAHHVFGVPTMRVVEAIDDDGELFWGVDSFGHLERHLSGNDPLQGLDMTAILDRPASASRR